MILPRRKALLGSLAAFVAAPAIVRVASIMPVRVVPPWEGKLLPMGFGAALTPDQDAVARAALDAFVADMKADGLWELMDRIWLPLPSLPSQSA